MLMKSYETKNVRKYFQGLIQLTSQLWKYQKKINHLQVFDQQNRYVLQLACPENRLLIFVQRNEYNFNIFTYCSNYIGESANENYQGKQSSNMIHFDFVEIKVFGC